MFPLNSNDQYIDSNGKRSTLGDAIGSGGGAGSIVSITPVLTEGTKIADFEIDGDEGSLYAPAGGGGGSIVCKRGTQNFTLGANGWNSFSASFGSDFADTNYTWLYSITITSSQTDSSKIPINVFVKTKNVGSISGRIYNANDELITGIVEWVAIHL